MDKDTQEGALRLTINFVKGTVCAYGHSSELASGVLQGLVNALTSPRAWDLGILWRFEFRMLREEFRALGF